MKSDYILLSIFMSISLWGVQKDSIPNVIFPNLLDDKEDELQFFEQNYRRLKNALMLSRQLGSNSPKSLEDLLTQQVDHSNMQFLWYVEQLQNQNRSQLGKKPDNSNNQ